MQSGWNQDFYAILGIDTKSSSDQIAKAYRRLALIHHPDKNKSSNATAEFQTISLAYEVLQNDETRARYDAHRSKKGTNGSPTKQSQSASPPNEQPEFFDRHPDERGLSDIEILRRQELRTMIERLQQDYRQWQSRSVKTSRALKHSLAVLPDVTMCERSLNQITKHIKEYQDYLTQIESLRTTRILIKAYPDSEKWQAVDTFYEQLTRAAEEARQQADHKARQANQKAAREAQTAQEELARKEEQSREKTAVLRREHWEAHECAHDYAFRSHISTVECFHCPYNKTFELKCVVCGLRACGRCALESVNYWMTKWPGQKTRSPRNSIMPVLQCTKSDHAFEPSQHPGQCVNCDRAIHTCEHAQCAHCTLSLCNACLEAFQAGHNTDGGGFRSWKTPPFG